MDKNAPLIQALLKEDAEFRLLFEEHEDLERKLGELDSIHYLNADQELERRQIQKLKLRGRDRMEQIIQQARHRTALA